MANIEDVTDFFPEVADDLSEVTWAHAVNSQEELTKAISDTGVMMLEADVSAGRLNGTGEQIPIMAHPPAIESDLSLRMWVDQVIAANEAGKKKGAKLDFKDVDIVEDSLNILDNVRHKINFPLWLNADILQGPVDAGKPVDADTFLNLCKNYFPEATLSIGWTTRFTNADDPEGAYTQSMVEVMEKVVMEDNDIRQPITFPVRAAFVKNSLKELTSLVDKVPNSTLTVWSSSSDEVDIGSLCDLRDDVGHDMVFFDLPLVQQHEFDACKNGGGVVQPSNPTFWSMLILAVISALFALWLY